MRKLSYNPEAPAMIEAFIQFHRDNPAVYSELKRLSFQLRRVGHKQYGIKSLFEVVRWHTALNTGNDDFKINNNFGAFFARLLMHHEPELKGFFKVRSSVADDYPIVEMVGRSFLWSVWDEDQND